MMVHNHESVGMRITNITRPNTTQLTPSLAITVYQAFHKRTMVGQKLIKTGMDDMPLLTIPRRSFDIR